MKSKMSPSRCSRMKKLSYSGGGGGLLMVLMMLLSMVKESVELRSTHPLHHVVDKVNENGGPYIGLVMAFPTEEAVLLDSGLFVPSSYIPYIQYTGRIFNIGTIRGIDIVYVMTGEQTVNAGVTVQILLDLFDVSGIVHYGIAGSTNDNLVIGDVAVPEYFAFTDSWKWTDTEADDTNTTELKIWEYNNPKEGGNLLGKVQFTRTELFTEENNEENVFWMSVYTSWYNISKQLTGVNLTNCMNDIECLPNDPKIVHGVRGSTASVILENAAYRKFLYNELNVSVADEESASVVMTSLSNGVPCIVFRAISDMAGAPVGELEDESHDLQRDGKGKKLGSSSWSYVAATNAFNVAVEFIEIIAGNSTSKSTS